MLYVNYLNNNKKKCLGTTSSTIYEEPHDKTFLGVKMFINQMLTTTVSS